MISFKKYKSLSHFKRYPMQFIKNLFNIHLHQFIFKRLYHGYDKNQYFLPYPPKYVTIAIDGYCMNACEFCSSHCFDSGKNEYSNHQYKIPYFLSLNDFCKIVDMCYKAKVPHVHIVAAGEPFLNKDVFKMIDYLIYKYGNVTIQSNFSKKLFETKNIIQEILKRKAFIRRITTDIFPREIHNKIKKGSDYDFTVNRIGPILIFRIKVK